MKEELEGITENNINPTRVYFNVYKISNNLYLNEDLCNEYHIGNKDETKKIKEQTCYLINENDLETITKTVPNQERIMIPNIINIFDLQLVLSFNVYVDTNHDRKLYVSDGICSRFHIVPLSKRRINNETYGNVTEEDLTSIETQSTKERARLKRSYKEIELEDETLPADYLFLIYIDNTTNKKYVTRDIYEMFKKSEIEIEAEPKIIDNKNCYSITENQLKEVEDKLHYRSIERLCNTQSPVSKPINNQAQIYNNEKVNDDIRPYLDRIMPVLGDDDIIKIVLGDDDIVKEVLGDNDTIKNVLGDDDIVKEVLRDDDIIKNVLGDNDIVKPVIEEIPKKEIMIYQDMKTSNLYIPTDSENATITIMNKPCKEINSNELGSLKDHYIIAKVFLTEKQVFQVIICNNNGKYFVSHDTISKLGFYIEKPHRIMVNKEIYEEISLEDIDIIKQLESDSCHINIVMKQITPKKG